MRGGGLLSTNGQSVHLEQPPAPPVTAAEQQVGLNGAIAATLTGWVGSMWALYAALTLVTGWMALASWGPLHAVDPYPFTFMLFVNNVVQLLLCLVILVGQRVLSVAADRRALQTYENAEAIFAQVTELQDHLDRHDSQLSRGISLLESRPHPWIEQHHVKPPPQAKDEAVSVNGRIAAWLTQRLGSMWAVYIALATQVLWIVLAQRLDPYPFLFMTFLSALAQLVFMIVIMVGQDVLRLAADRRSEQTFLDAEAILYECQRMKARLSAQDRIISSLCDYTHYQITERLARAIHDTYARAIHEAYLEASADRGETAGARASLRSWEELPEELKEANRAQARHVGEKLAELGCIMVPAFDQSLTFAYRDEGEVLLLARLEHERWMQERIAMGYEYGPVREGRFHPDLVPWERLTKEARDKDLEAVRNIPAMLTTLGFQVLRVTERTAETA